MGGDLLLFSQILIWEMYNGKGTCLVCMRCGKYLLLLQEHNYIQVDITVKCASIFKATATAPSTLQPYK